MYRFVLARFDYVYRDLRNGYKKTKECGGRILHRCRKVNLFLCPFMDTLLFKHVNEIIYKSSRAMEALDHFGNRLP